MKVTNRFFNNLCCALIAAALTALAQSSVAAGPQKTYSIQFATAPTYLNNPPNVDVPVGTSVTVRNESPPSDANSNIGSFQVTVNGLVVDPNTAISCPRANCSASGNTITVTNISKPIKAQESYTVGFAVTSCGEGSIADITVYNGSSLNGNTFKQSSAVLASSPSCGTLDCSTSFIVPDSMTGTVVHGTRSVDKDGVCADTQNSFTVPYYVTNTLSKPNGNLHFKWPQGDPTTTVDVDSLAVFRYTIDAAPSISVVAWLPANSNSPVFIAAPTCIGDVPAAYASLAADLTINASKIKVLSTPAGLPAQFPITIGTERMQVTSVNANNNTWNVTRHTGGTAAAKHVTGDAVMSTPLPILAGYTFSPSQLAAGYANGNQAQMCLVGPLPSNTLIDIGDGWGGIQ
jgi:hypothetical protein